MSMFFIHSKRKRLHNKGVQFPKEVRWGHQLQHGYRSFVWGHQHGRRKNTLLLAAQLGFAFKFCPLGAHE